MNQLDNSDQRRFDSLIEYLWNYPADFCLVYRKAKSWGRSLNLRGAFSHRYKSQHDGEKSGEEYRLLATDCYYRRRDRIIEEMLNPRSNTWKSVEVSKGRLFKALRILTPTPANSVGKRWWQLVVASGPTRDAGYVIVTRVAARDATELHQCIKGIQEIMKNETTNAGEMPARQ